MTTAGVGEFSGAQKWLITLSAMLVTVMQVIDTSVTNVVLPHMQGSLSRPRRARKLPGESSRYPPPSRVPFILLPHWGRGQGEGGAGKGTRGPRINLWAL